MCACVSVCIDMCAFLHSLPFFSILLSSLTHHRDQGLCIESELLHGKMHYEQELELQVIRLQWLFCQALGMNANY